MINDINDFHRVFFIGVAGSGMSALAQYLSGTGKTVAGSDRYFENAASAKVRRQLEAENISCYPQDGSGVTPETDLVIVSTAIEDHIPDVKKANELGIPVLRRSELLALISRSKKTIAVAGTSGKSTTAAMLYQILLDADYHPSIISGAGLTTLIKQDKIGNAAVGTGDWLIIEADESDGSVVQYTPEIGLLLNIDKDHQEIEELMELFTTFRSHTKGLFITNQSNSLAKQLSVDKQYDFGFETEAGYSVENFRQIGFIVSFTLKNQNFTMTSLGRHSAENAAAAVAVAHQIGISLETCAQSLAQYEGIYRRHQILGSKNGVTVIDDYAHNPAKCAASIQACQPLAPKVVAWFQPHGYKPTRFLKPDFIAEIAKVLRAEDEIWMSEIYYAGGTATKDISAQELTDGIRGTGKKAFFVENREELLSQIRPHLEENTVFLLMGARDPGLEDFVRKVYANL